MARPKGIPCSLAHRKKLSKIAKQKGFGLWMIGRKLSKKHRDNIGKGNKGKTGYWEGKKQPQSMIDKRVKKLIGHKVSKVTRYKIGYAQLGEKNHNWKGGITKDEHGYILIRKKEHPHTTKKGYVREHRLVVEKEIGRYLLSTEEIHHLGKENDNRPKMLMGFINKSAHQRFERSGNVKQKEIIFDGRKLKHSV